MNDDGRSISRRNVLAALGTIGVASAGAGLGPPDQFDTDGDGTFDPAQFLPSDGAGSTLRASALDLSRRLLNDQGRNEARKTVTLIADGLPDYTGQSSDIDVTASGTDRSESVETGSGPSTEATETANVANAITGEGVELFVAGAALSDGADAYFINNLVGDDADPSTAQPDCYFDVDTFADLPGIADDIAAMVLGSAGSAGDEVILTGSLGELETQLTGNEGRGLPLDGDRSTPFDELDDPEKATTRECFTAATTHCFGLPWWLPVDHASGIQSDGVSFDLGFCTEQCATTTGAA